MGRTCRNNLPNVVYHCITRFVDRDWFFDADEERAHYLDLLGKALEHSDWRCIAFALMSSHIHLAMIAGRQPMESWTKATHAPFAHWMNRRHGRLGPVLAERPKDYMILPVNVGRVIAYIHNSPVRAGVVARAADATWTSHRAYLDPPRTPTVLQSAEGLGRAGFEDVHVFDEWVDRTPGNAFDITLERQAVMMRRRGALVRGTPAIREPEDPYTASWSLHAGMFAHPRVDPWRIIQVVAELSEVAMPVIQSRRRIPAAGDARRVVAHVARALGVTPSETAEALGISAQAVGAMCRREVGEHVRIVYDLAVEKLEIELDAAREEARAAELGRRAESDGVPDRISSNTLG